MSQGDPAELHETTSVGPRQVVHSPEQVELHLPVTGPTTRILAYAIDLVVVLILEVGLVLVLMTATPLAAWVSSRVGQLKLPQPGTQPDPDALAPLMFLFALILLVQLVIEWAYFIFMEVTTNGRSIGKRAVGLRVVRDGGGPITLRDSIVRNLLRTVDMLPTNYVVGLVAMLVSREGKRLGDLAAGTVVIRIDKPLPALPLPEEPVPGDAEFRLERAQLEALGPRERELIRQALRRHVELEPAAAEHHLALGEALERSGALPEAIDSYRAASAADPRSPDGHERIANLYAANNRCDGAVPEYEKALALAPRVSRLKIALGDCKAKLGKHDDAAKLYREVLKADPAAVQVLYRLARAVHETDSAKAALPWYERAAREDPKNAMPHYYLGYLYKERNQKTKAVQEFRKYLALKPDSDEKKDIEAEIDDLGGNR